MEEKKNTHILASPSNVNRLVVDARSRKYFSIREKILKIYRLEKWTRINRNGAHILNGNSRFILRSKIHLVLVFWSW